MKTGSFPKLRNQPLICLLIWTPNDAHQLNYRVKTVIRLFCDALNHKSKAKVDVFRRIISIIAQIIAIMEQKKRTNEKKLNLVDYLHSQIKSKTLFKFSNNVFYDFVDILT